MTVDLSAVPLIAISHSGKQLIATLLNPTKFLPCENGLPRDWRGLAHLLELSGEVMSLLVSHLNPTMHMLTLMQENQRDVTIKDFQTMMERIDRWDVIDDTETIFETDAAKYFEESQRAQVSADIIEKSTDQEVLTLGDAHRLRQGLDAQHYDAFLLYADEDIIFVNEMVQKLEIEYKLKLCLKDRDLIGGLTFEHEAVMKLIHDRCNRLLVILSPSFLKSSANTFFMNYAQAISIDKRQRKIIPCLYKSCELPLLLKYIFILDYNRRGLYDFWGKLRDSVQVPSSNIQSTVQRIAEVANISLDNCGDISLTCKVIKEESSSRKISLTCEVLNEEPSKCLKYTEDHSMEVISNAKALNSASKKSNTLLQWVRDTSNRKMKFKQNNQSVAETIPNLPSLDNLDSLDSSTAVVDEKKEKKLFGKLAKKIQMKKISTKI